MPRGGTSTATDRGATVNLFVAVVVSQRHKMSNYEQLVKVLRVDFLFTTVFGLAVHVGGTLRYAASSCCRDFFFESFIAFGIFLRLHQ